MKTHTANHSAAAMLETRRRQLLETTENLGESGYEHADTWSEAIELGQTAAARNTSEALRHLLDEIQLDVERALARLETGDYGICEDCSQPIPLERLRVLPEATTCVRCQRHRNDDPRIKACA
jgi:RNA polymerase-binding transcription factor DksA